MSLLIERNQVYGVFAGKSLASDLRTHSPRVRIVGTSGEVRRPPTRQRPWLAATGISAFCVTVSRSRHWFALIVLGLAIAGVVIGLGFWVGAVGVQEVSNTSTSLDLDQIPGLFSGSMPIELPNG